MSNSHHPRSAQPCRLHACLTYLPHVSVFSVIAPFLHTSRPHATLAPPPSAAPPGQPRVTLSSPTSVQVEWGAAQHCSVTKYALCVVADGGAVSRKEVGTATQKPVDVQAGRAYTFYVEAAVKAASSVLTLESAVSAELRVPGVCMRVGVGISFASSALHPPPSFPFSHALACCAALPMPTNLAVDMASAERAVQWLAGTNPVACNGIEYVLTCRQGSRARSRRRARVRSDITPPPWAYGLSPGVASVAGSSSHAPATAEIRTRAAKLTVVELRAKLSPGDYMVSVRAEATAAGFSSVRIISQETTVEALTMEVMHIVCRK